MKVCRYDAILVRRILDCLGPGSIAKDDMQALNTEGKLVQQGFVMDCEIMSFHHHLIDITSTIANAGTFAGGGPEIAVDHEKHEI